MTSNLRLELTPTAERDFRGILRYTRKRWDEHQRAIYAARLTKVMDELTRFSYLGQTRSDIPPEMRAKTIGEHIVFYRIDEQVLTVIRILHQEMDAPAHLNP
jgi:toxin ParE1/3/4